MNEKEKIQKSVEIIKSKTNIVPEIGIILGSGLGDYAKKIENPVTISYNELPGFPVSTVEGHAGQIVLGVCQGKNVIAMQGRVHYYEGYSQREITLPIRILKRLGVKKMIITNAAGGTNKEFNPGNLMIIRGHINFSGDNPLIGENVDEDGPRFPDLSQVYDETIRNRLREVTSQHGIKLWEGIYMMHSGPSYASPGEVMMGKTIGADAIGMSTVPEVIVCAHCGIQVLGITCISNLAPGISNNILSHEEVIENAARAKDIFIKVIDLALSEVL